MLKKIEQSDYEVKKRTYAIYLETNGIQGDISSHVE